MGSRKETTVPYVRIMPCQWTDYGVLMSGFSLPHPRWIIVLKYASFRNIGDETVEGDNLERKDVEIDPHRLAIASLAEQVKENPRIAKFSALYEVGI